MANEKILNTRIQLKYDTWAGWSNTSVTGQGANLVLKAGEIGICEIPTSTNAGQSTSEPVVLFKVGNGTSVFSALPWVSAKAADVYAWAKEATLKVEKDGTGNVVAGIEWDANLNGGKGGIKYTTASVATSEGLAALQKDIDDNRDTWAKNTTYTFTQSADGKSIVITPSEGNVKTISFAFLTQEEIDALNHLVAADITTGSTNGTIAVEGVDVAVKGLQDAAYATVTSLNATAKGYADAVEAKLPTSADYGVLSVTNGDDTIIIGGTVQNPTVAVAANKFDANGSAAAVLGDSNDVATANTVYGAKAAAAAAQSDATIAKTKIETFLGTITPDGSQDIIDTLAEINSYVGEHGEEFAALSAKVTNIENGTTTVPKAGDADTLDGKDSTDFATKEQGQAADSAIQSLSLLGKSLNKTTNTLTVDEAKDALGLGSLAGKSEVTFDDVDYTLNESILDGSRALDIVRSNSNDQNPESVVIWNRAKSDAEGNVITETYATKDELEQAIDAIPEDKDTWRPIYIAGTYIADVSELQLTNSKTIEFEVVSGGGSGVEETPYYEEFTASIKNHSIGADHIKAHADYTGADAEVWVFNCGSASVNV